MDLCLVGKVIGPRPAYKEGIEKAMKGVWKINHRFQVEELSSKNVFQFFFRSREDRQRVFGGGPWTIDKQLISCMTELFAKEWGEQISKLEDIKIVNGTMKALDCPLRDFAGDNPNFDSGRFSSWMCAPGSPPRDRYRFNKKRDESPNNRPIMTMGEASRIDSAVERNRDDCIGGDKVMMETVTGSEAAVVDVVPEKKKGKEVAVDIGLTGKGRYVPLNSGSSPRAGGSGKRKMDGDYTNEVVKKGRTEEMSDMTPGILNTIFAKSAEQTRQEPFVTYVGMPRDWGTPMR
ncbi:hypothetical protein F8388_005011 [Cannabis sativa]|uniref:DUF4283 domain-containing protein n=1 Tax=Cannabis sativa TaxID=3483 RepID=A0A7J6FYV0_CANSA|nr:hypothetical protein F8388_005011 [Cannabis sativa]